MTGDAPAAATLGLPSNPNTSDRVCDAWLPTGGAEADDSGGGSTADGGMAVLSTDMGSGAGNTLDAAADDSVGAGGSATCTGGTDADVAASATPLATPVDIAGLDLRRVRDGDATSSSSPLGCGSSLPPPLLAVSAPSVGDDNPVLPLDKDAERSSFASDNDDGGDDEMAPPPCMSTSVARLLLSSTSSSSS